MKSLLFTMSLSGTVVFLFYMCLRPVLERFCSAKWRYGILKLALFFFLFPVPWFKFNLLDVVSFFCPFIKNSVPKSLPLRFDTEYSIVVTNSTIFFSNNIKKIILVSCLLLAVAIIIMVAQIQKNKRFTYHCEHYAVQNIKDQKLQAMAETLKIENAISQKLFFYESEYIETPLVMRLFRPIVLLPNSCIEKLSDKQLRMILQHELLHIKHKDLWFKFLGIVVISFHWYNPVSWFLFYEICCASEEYCDEEVVSGLNRRYWKEYCELVLLLSAEIGGGNVKGYAPNTLVSRLSSTKYLIKRRIKVMKKQKDKYSKMLSRLVSCTLTVLICMAATITTFAYEPAMIFESNNEADKSVFAASEVWTYTEGVQTPLGVDVLPYDFFFTDEQGNVKELTGNGEGRASCFHNFVPGTATKHTKNSKGGCKIEYYNIEQCTKCGYTKEISRYNTVTYEVCIH